CAREGIYYGRYYAMDYW
nr:immunoglobulin heavy chain junction region [Mus musculus]MBK4187972.1 immunoglobulin heavy chain junction region [Mus musculus]